jgi:hypothetical protein
VLAVPVLAVPVLAVPVLAVRVLAVRVLAGPAAGTARASIACSWSATAGYCAPVSDIRGEGHSYRLVARSGA